VEPRLCSIRRYRGAAPVSRCSLRRHDCGGALGPNRPVRIFIDSGASRTASIKGGCMATEAIQTTEVNSQRLIFPGLAGFYQRGAPYAYAFMRFATGAVLAPHGIQKVFFIGDTSRYAANIAQKGLPLPELLAYLTFFAESAGAICLAIGLFTRVAAAMILIEMLVIIIFFQWQFGYFWTNRGVEYALLWLLLCTAIFFRGGGRYSVDHLIGKEF
jgi:putative oxidoreductase